MELVDKAAVVAEINRVVNSYDPTNEITSGRYTLVRLRNFIDTLDVKEVQEEPVSEELNMSARCFGFQNSEALFSFRLPAKAYLVGSEVKISIKQE